jgi:hypothetical protein
MLRERLQKLHVAPGQSELFNEAETIAELNELSPLRKGEMIRVTGLASAKHCAHPIVVRGRWGRRSLGVPLAQLKLIGTDKATARAIADWQYWMAHENDF